MDTPNTEWTRGVDICDIAEWKTLQIDVRTAQFVLVEDVQKIVDRLERENARLRAQLVRIANASMKDGNYSVEALRDLARAALAQPEEKKT